jgi:hypothetical protein
VHGAGDSLSMRGEKIEGIVTDSKEYALHREIEAAKVLRAQIAALADGDEDFARDVIEGETSIAEIIGSLVASEAEDDALVQGIADLITALQARKKRVETRIEHRRALMANGMEIAGRDKLETPGGTVAVADVAPKVIVQDEALIPSKYWRSAAPTLDKKALLADLKDRQKIIEKSKDIEDPVSRAFAQRSYAPDIPGACLSNGSKTIRINR